MTELDCAVRAALSRLHATGNPGCVLVDQGRWRRAHPGWELNLRRHDTLAPPVFLLASGRLLVGTRRVPVAELTPRLCTQLREALDRLGGGVSTQTSPRSLPSEPANALVPRD